MVPVLDLPLLSARSVAVSVLLGAHPARLTAAQLVATGEHVGVPAATMRVALTRAVAAGDLVRDDGTYLLGERHVARRARQDEAVADSERDWDGAWETAVVVAGGRPGPARVALRDELRGLRLAELREGVWMRPANLTRPGPVAEPDLLETMASRPDDPARLVARLWDLAGWAAQGDELAAYVAEAPTPAHRLTGAAALVRHIGTDPLLPPPLRPPGWPGERLRAVYAAYVAELAARALG